MGFPERDLGDPGGGGIFFPVGETGFFCSLVLVASFPSVSTFSSVSIRGSELSVSIEGSELSVSIEGSELSVWSNTLSSFFSST